MIFFIGQVGFGGLTASSCCLPGVKVLLLLKRRNCIELGKLFLNYQESGYGHIPDRVRFVPVPIMKLENCQKSYRFFITPRMLCAGYATGGKDACNVRKWLSSFNLLHKLLSKICTCSRHKRGGRGGQKWSILLPNLLALL